MSGLVLVGSAPARPRSAGARLATLAASLERQLPPRGEVKASLRSAMARGRRIRPGFADAWIALDAPRGAELIAQFRLPSATVKILSPPDGSGTVYWLIPDEYRLPVDELALLRDAMAEVRAAGGREVRSIPLADARRFVEEHASELLQAKLVKVGRDPASAKERATSLARVVARYTVGLGALEHLLEDARVTDIYSDAPCGGQPLYVFLSLADERVSDRLTTNITLCPEAVAALVTRARLEAGRPFSGARPYLEHDLKEFGARLTVIGQPVSPEGVAAAIRRHSSSPLTLAQLVAAGSLEPMTAGLLSVMVGGQCSLLIGGARGAGKTTLLGALMLEMDPSKRIITLEDTLELPVEAMRAHGYRVQALRVRSALGGEGEMSPQEALRLSLRLGESAIVLGEVRGAEAQTLYEAMRTGAAGSAVLGTIHGSPSSAVCTRAVHDLGVSPESFAATDAIIIAGLVRPGGARRQQRRVTEVAEVSLTDGALSTRNLLGPSGTNLEPKEEKLATSTVVAKIASAWGVPRSEVIREVRTRARLKERQVELSRVLAKPEIVSAAATAAANSEYARLRESGLRGEILVEAVIEGLRRRWG